MKKNVIIFGAYGVLGKGVTSVLLKKNYDKFYLFDFEAEQQPDFDKRVVNINIGDLSKEENVAAAFSRIEKSGSDIFFLFSTVGGFLAGVEIRDMLMQDIDKMFNINMKSNFILAKHFVNLAEHTGGAICFTSAYSAFNPEPGRAAYGASKSALNYIIQSLSEECLSKKISVTGIAPLILDTPANSEWMKPEELEIAQKPFEIGELVDFIFENYNFLSGNILSLRKRFNKK